MPTTPELSNLQNINDTAEVQKAAAVQADLNRPAQKYVIPGKVPSTENVDTLLEKYGMKITKEADDPASNMTPEKEGHGKALAMSDRDGGVAPEVTVRTLLKEGYNEAQIRKLLPGVSVIVGNEKPDKNATGGGGVAEVQ